MVTFPVVFRRECSAITSYGKWFTLVHNEIRATWNQSKFECSEQDQSLGSALSQNEEGILTAVSADTLWVRLTDLENEGQYVWVDGSTFTSVNWYTGNPKNSPISNYIAVQLGQYGDVGCYYMMEWHLCTSTGE